MGVSASVKRLAVLGSTGSIGRQTLDIVRSTPGFEIVGLAAGRNVDLLTQQMAEFHPAMFSVAEDRALPGTLRCAERVSLEAMVASPDVDLVVVGTVGMAGLAPTLAALKAGKAVALANKEVFVMAGRLVTETARRYGGTLLPVDSEHSAIWQCLLGEAGDPWPAIDRIILTASGGAFRDLPASALAAVTPAEALHHPTWRMGQKITVDCATLMNKGFEVIEAHWLFGYPLSQIDVMLHRESIVHSLVAFPDGSVKAQLGTPDMRAPLQFALTYPQRAPSPVAALDLLTAGPLTFAAVDYDQYPCLKLALQAAHAGGTYPAVLSAADEEAVQLFLHGRIAFTGIHQRVDEALQRHESILDPTLDDVLEADAWARRHVTLSLAV
ncbi:MAG: 1-deoxy-D-xylulose-5-phosphate reductoisomerase [Dehalococcoidia bacterium]|nr:1-deoxy-D-xylulose-5-phosphate reductoisomerase [Dehalococcoidia bacterium]